MLSTHRTLIGHISKFCKAAFHKIPGGVDGLSHLSSKRAEKRRQAADLRTLVSGNQMQGSESDGTHLAPALSYGLILRRFRHPEPWSPKVPLIELKALGIWCGGRRFDQRACVDGIFRACDHVQSSHQSLQVSSTEQDDRL
jgi:hypothetical protein